MKTDSNRFLPDIFRSMLYSIIITLVCILVFALVVKFAELTEGVIRPVNQIIKVVSIFAGLLLGLKTREKGLSKGFIAGLLFTAVSILLFSVLSGQSVLTSANLLEVLVGAITGAISGAIILLLKK